MVALTIDRLAHQTKLFVGKRLEQYLSNQYWRGKGPASRLISVSSGELKQIGVDRTILVDQVSVKNKVPDYFLEGAIEGEYRNRFLSGESLTMKAGIFSGQNVDVSFPTSMHQVGKHILNEVMLAPYLLTNPKYYFGLESMRFTKKSYMMVLSTCTLISAPTLPLSRCLHRSCLVSHTASPRTARKNSKKPPCSRLM